MANDLKTAEILPAETLPAAPAETIDQKIERLQAETRAAYKAQHVYDDPFTDDAKAAANVYNGLNGQLTAAISEKAAQAAQAAQAELKNARVAIATNARDLAIIYGKLSATLDEKAPELIEAETAMNSAVELNTNELLAKYGGSTPAKKSGSNGTAKKATNDDAIHATIVKLWLDSGKLISTSAFENELGFARATAWHAVNNWKKANGMSTADVDAIIEKAGSLAVAQAVQAAKTQISK